jgi:hypothetical protein
MRVPSVDNRPNTAGPGGQSSDWLGGLIVIARAAAAAGGLAPFPFIKIAAEVIVVFLQTIEVSPTFTALLHATHSFDGRE